MNKSLSDVQSTRRAFLRMAGGAAVAATGASLWVPNKSIAKSLERVQQSGKTVGSGFSKARLERMRNVMSGYVERGEIPGLISLVSRNGETHVEVMGTKTAGVKDPMQRDTIFRIASLTKPITAAAAMILVEECRIRLDDPVDNWLPELANRKVLKTLGSELSDVVPASRPIKVRDLLDFRLGYGFTMDLFMNGELPIAKEMMKKGVMPSENLPAMSNMDDYMKTLGSLPLLFQPGERWLYNTGSDVLGVLLSRVSGKPLEVFLRERIFDPLGMKDTSFSVPASKLGRLATHYQPNAQTGKLDVFDTATNSRFSKPPGFPSGAGGLVSTLDDYFAFGAMMLSNGKHGKDQILSRASVEAMSTDQMTPEQRKAEPLFFSDNRGWGFGVSVFTKRTGVSSSPGRYGWDGGYGTSWYADPHENMQGILLTQVMWTAADGPPVYHDFWTLAYQAIT